MIKAHGAGLYRISALNRSPETSVNLSASATQVSATDTVVLDVTVTKTGSAVAQPTGSVVITNNDTLVGVVPVDAFGKAAYRVVGLGAGSHSFKAKYSGNAVYSPQVSNNISLELLPVSTRIFRGKSKVAVIMQDQRRFLSGVKSGDKIILYNSLGQLIASFQATSDRI